MGSLIEFLDISLAYDGTVVVGDLSLKINHGERWAFIGKNGTGKSSIIKAVAGILKPIHGQINLSGKSVSDYHSRERARWLAYMPQQSSPVIPYTVKDYVMLGRHAHQGVWALAQPSDYAEVIKAMEICDIIHLQNRLVTTLSGGELQRVLLAGAVVQDAKILLLDEPTTFLDPSHERYFYKALERLYIEKQLTVLMVTHDLNSAIEYSTHICALESGKLFFSGTKEIFVEACPGILNQTFSVDFQTYHSITAHANIYRANS